jgi:hypothetical protein
MVKTEQHRTDLHSFLGYRPLTRTWAKVEVLLDPGAAGAGLLLGDWVLSRAAGEIQWGLAAAALALFVLGGYLAMAGHRSQLYQSMNELTAYLVEEIRRLQDKG